MPKHQQPAFFASFDVIHYLNKRFLVPIVVIILLLFTQINNSS
jgi:hypothetical protein